MKLFKTKEQPCCCKDVDSKKLESVCSCTSNQGIKVLGSGCKKCVALEEATKKAIEELGVNIEVTHITDFAEIASYGVMTTPALVLKGKVVSYGKVLTVDEIKEIVNKELHNM
ncbi:thioredoxin family protein [Anaerorhabdus sp.]|uniref:thioredoxin family protein n=1 Tax=Anaerorhabdus sp. TaxID=1872524 RepID=UPI002FC5F848